MNKNYCLIIDSGMDVLKVKQEKIQKLLDNKDIAPLDIKEHLGSEDIIDLIDTIIVNFNMYNKYDIQYIVDCLNNVICDFESEGN